MIETVRLSQDQRNKLMKVRKTTGIKNWNVLCRWAFCHSIYVDNNPPNYVKGGKTGVEMDWETFTGRDNKIVFEALIQRIGSDQFYNHLHRGIEILVEKDSLSILAEV